tara:strand:- start:1065 stop:1424 length:360 start_codon:yes stop_codon:yes gene_type:complete
MDKDQSETTVNDIKGLMNSLTFMSAQIKSLEDKHRVKPAFILRKLGELSCEEKPYRIQFISNTSGDDDDDWSVDCVAYSEEDAKNIISACAAYTSGDVCTCYINGVNALLDGDRGLLKL